MNKSTIPAASCATALYLITLQSQAALNGVLPATPAGTDYQAYYDDVAHLTWLADANAAGVTMDYPSAAAWVAGVNINGVTGWRLPTTLQPDPSCSSQVSGDSFGFDCTGSEMGNLFYNVLGGIAGSSISTIHNSNYNLFSNVQDFAYWSSTQNASLPNFRWIFNYNFGYQTNGYFADFYYAWPVQSGNAGAADTDSDGINDSIDNCTNVANAGQEDTDSDGHGNICDGDFDNSCGVNFFDLVAFKAAFGGTDPDYDMDSSGGAINFFDLVLFKGVFGGTPGPSAPGALCP